MMGKVVCMFYFELDDSSPRDFSQRRPLPSIATEKNIDSSIEKYPLYLLLLLSHTRPYSKVALIFLCLFCINSEFLFRRLIYLTSTI